MFVKRTLGLSCAYKIGVETEAEVSVLEYRSCYRFMIVATDGFWDVVDCEEAVRLVERGGELEKAGGQLMEEAVRRWKAKNLLMDDISFIIVALQGQGS